MPSSFEDTPVDDLDVGGMTLADLQDIVDNDGRKGAVAKAQAELDRRDEGEGDGEDEDAGEPAVDAGQAEVQEYFDKVEESGTFPPSGPPDESHTIAGHAAADEAAAEAEEAEEEEEE